MNVPRLDGGISRGQRGRHALDGTPMVTSSGIATCIFDGDCGLCHRSVKLARGVGSTCAFIPFQEVTAFPQGITRERCTQEVVFIDDRGIVFGGAAAVAQILRTSKVKLIGKIIDARPILPLSGMVYRCVARNRGRIPGRGYCDI